MKGFKFKLEAVLKLRSFEEDKIKMRLGKLNIAKEKLLVDLQKQNSSIDQSYEAQNGELMKAATAQSLSFYPAYIEAKYQNITIIKSKIKDLDEAIEGQTKLLAQQKAKVKVLAEMKEEQKINFRKLKMKKIDETIEENNILWGALRGEIK